jgi:tRNA G18 (ribose-2'-O)-methylase SpoU
LVVGNEQKGIPDGILNEAEEVCHIEMIGGHISSLNVSVATSIALYEISQFFVNRQCAPPLYGQALS